MRTLALVPPDLCSWRLLVVQSEKHRNEEATAIEKDGQVVADRVYYTKQTVGNACGTVGLIHAVANCGDVLGGDVPLGMSPLPCWPCLAPQVWPEHSHTPFAPCTEQSRARFSTTSSHAPRACRLTSVLLRLRRMTLWTRRKLLPRERA